MCCRETDGAGQYLDIEDRRFESFRGRPELTVFSQRKDHFFGSDTYAADFPGLPECVLLVHLELLGSSWVLDRLLKKGHLIGQQVWSGTARRPQSVWGVIPVAVVVVNEPAWVEWTHLWSALLPLGPQLCERDDSDSVAAAVRLRARVHHDRVHAPVAQLVS